MIVSLPSYHRSHLELLLSRLAEKPARLISLAGPRQCGKTTLVLQALNRTDRPYQYLSSDAPSPTESAPWRSDSDDRHPIPLPADTTPNTQWLVYHWQQARIAASQSPTGFVLVLDEIHRIADWSRTVKGLWDQDQYSGTNLHVVLLGSAPLLMRTGLSESLTGRFESLHLSHWSFDEMKAAFGVTLDEYVFFGGYPGAARFTETEERWRDYVLDALIEPTLDRDILDLTRVDKPSLLRQLFELTAAFSGQIVSYSKLLGQLQDAGNTTTLARYLELLSKVGLLTGLDNYAPGVIKRKRSIPKLQVLNTALTSAYSDYSFSEAKKDRTYWGRLVESAVGAHLCNIASTGVRIYYWRDGKEEVDFVVVRGPNLLGIEVKTRAQPRRTTGLQAFQDKYRAARVLTVGTGGVSLGMLCNTSTAEHLWEL